MVDNPGQLVTDSEEKVVKKKNKRVAKRKERLAKLCALVRFPSSPHFKSSPLFLSCFVPAPVPAIVPTPVPALILTLVTTPISCLASLAILSSYCVPVPAAFAALSSSSHASVSYRGILALLFLLPVLGLPLRLRSSPIKTFKQSLSNELWLRV